MKSYSIGREGDCNIVLNDPSDVTSRHHALLTVSSSGKMTITDQGSSNGTYVNGIMITPNVPVPVTRKDTISFAHVITLDWNMIPKSGQWIKYVIGGLAAAAVIVAGIVFIPKIIDNYKGSGEPIPEPGNFVVSYFANEGKGEMEAQMMKGGEQVQLAENKFTREDYDFDGWKDEKGMAYEDKAMVTLNSNLKLYAQWKKTVAVITFDKNGGGDKMEPQKVKIGLDTVLNKNTFTNRGHKFVGWSTVRSPKKNESSVFYPDESKVNIDKDITLYAQWEKVETNCTITFDANGGTGSMASMTVKIGRSVSLPANNFKREGYEFVGWKTRANGGDVYGNKASIMPNGDMKLYAQWKQITNDRL